MSVVQTLLAFVAVHPILALFITPVVIISIRSLYRVSPLHPLYHIPGPIFARLTSLWLKYQAYIGEECTAVHRLHQRYGSVVCTGPDSVDISDGNALHQIYVEKGGFLKPDFYGNFDIDGHKSIFSETDPRSRGERARAVVPLFSTASLRAGSEAIAQAVDGFVERMKREIVRARDQGGKFDVLVVCRALAIDAVTAYLFETKYGGCTEDIKPDTSKKDADSTGPEKLTASGMVDAFVAVGKIWYLPPRTFQLVERATLYFWPNNKIDQSINTVDLFVTDVVDKASTEKTSTSSYPSRLLQAGFTTSEVKAQCKDLIFAGTDSTAMNLATIFFMLVKNPTTYKTLRQELLSTNPNDEDLQSLPYLRGVVREGLRLGMANPSRLPRVVPPPGLTFNDIQIPTGTIVSCAPFELHLNPVTFPDPLVFKPERWLPENNPSEAMSRDHIPFGLGTRQCIARNLATWELFCAVKSVVMADLLHGMDCAKERIEIMEWFNSNVVGERIELVVAGRD